MLRHTDITVAAAAAAVLLLTICVDSKPLAAYEDADLESPTSGLVLLQLDAPRLSKTASETSNHGALINITLLEQMVDAALGTDPDEETAFSRAIKRLGLAVFIGGVAVALTAAYRFGTGKENM